MLKKVVIPKVMLTKFDDETGGIKEEKENPHVMSGLYNIVSAATKNPEDVLMAHELQQQIVDVAKWAPSKQRFLLMEESQYNLMKRLIAPDGDYEQGANLPVMFAPVIKAFKNPEDVEIPKEKEKKGKKVDSDKKDDGKKD